MMSRANPLVKCGVEECTHWMRGNQCMAAKVAIYNEDAGDETEGEKDTQCKSFHLGDGVGDYVGALHNANVGGTLSAAFLDGTQITPTVECYVANCKYWGEGNNCEAESIEVGGANSAKTDDTDCTTFELK